MLRSKSTSNPLCAVVYQYLCDCIKFFFCSSGYFGTLEMPSNNCCNRKIDRAVSLAWKREETHMLPARKITGLSWCY